MSNKYSKKSIGLLINKDIKYGQANGHETKHLCILIKQNYFNEILPFSS